MLDLLKLNNDCLKNIFKYVVINLNKNDERRRGIKILNIEDENNLSCELKRYILYHITSINNNMRDISFYVFNYIKPKIYVHNSDKMIVLHDDTLYSLCMYIRAQLKEEDTKFPYIGYSVAPRKKRLTVDEYVKNIYDKLNIKDNEEKKEEENYENKIKENPDIEYDGEVKIYLYIPYNLSQICKKNYSLRWDAVKKLWYFYGRFFNKRLLKYKVNKKYTKKEEEKLIDDEKEYGKQNNIDYTEGKVFYFLGGRCTY